MLRALESCYAYEHGDDDVKGSGLTFLYVCSCLLATGYQVLYMALAVGFSKRCCAFAFPILCPEIIPNITVSHCSGMCRDAPAALARI